MAELAAQLLYVSKMLGDPVLGDADQPIGKLADLVAEIKDEHFPSISGLAVTRGRERFFVPIVDVPTLSDKGIHLNTSKVDLRPFERREGQLLLQKDVMDKQIVDVKGTRLVRVSDIELAVSPTGWRLGGVDVSTYAFLARIGLGKLLASRMTRDVIPWDGVQFFASEAPVKLKIGYDKVAGLHPMDIAHLVSQLGYQQGSELISGLDDALAADTVEGMLPEQQVMLISALPKARAADILDEMAPDDAADVLKDLPKEHADELLTEMDPLEAAEVMHLLGYPDQTAGGLMTTEYLAVPQDLTVQGIIERIRDLPWLPDLIYYIYVVDSEKNGHLQGVISVRMLLLSEREQLAKDIMSTGCITGHPDDKAHDIARKIAHYNLVALPILDSEDHLLGIVTVDDAMDVILPKDWMAQMPRMFR